MKRWYVPTAAAVALALTGSYFLAPMLQGQQTASPAVQPELYSYREVVKRVLPAVVSIEAKVKTTKVKMARPPIPNFDDKGIPEEFKKFFEDFKKKGGIENFEMPYEGPRAGFGSGFFVDPAGVVLTNHHVVEGADSVVVTLKDGRKFNSKEIHSDHRTDLAVIRLDTRGEKDFPHLEMGESETMEIGDRVLAVGAPFGLTGTVTHGIVSGKGRTGLSLNMYEDFVQTDAAINPGNSGGPLVNLEGKVIGINSAIKTRSGGFQGVGLAISSNMAKNVMKSLLTDGVVRRGYLGVSIRDLDPDVAARLGLEKGVGVVVGEVFANSPAAKAGIQAGDVVLKINGSPVKDGRSLQGIVAGLSLNKAVDVIVQRDGQNQTLPVTVEEQPREFGTALAPVQRPTPRSDSQSMSQLGIEFTELNDQLCEDFGFKKGTTGVVITKVDPASAAHEAGLRKGMLLLKVDNHKVATTADARQHLQAASPRGLLLQVQSPQGGVNFVILRSGAEAATK